MEVMPVDSRTAKPMTSYEGNTAIVRKGRRLENGPFPRHAIVKSTEGLTQASENLPSATALIAPKPPVVKDTAIPLGSFRLGVSESFSALPMGVSVCSTPSAAFHDSDASELSYKPEANSSSPLAR